MLQIVFMIMIISTSSLRRFRDGSEEMTCKLLIGEIRSAAMQIQRDWLPLNSNQPLV